MIRDPQMPDSCLKCGRQLADDFDYCPGCGISLSPDRKRSRSLTVSAALGIIAACISVVLGILFLLDGSFNLQQPYYFGYTFGEAQVVAGFLSLFAFVFGLTGGILTLRKRHFEIGVFGFGLLILGSVLSLIVGYGGLFLFLFFGLPILVLSVLGFALINARSSEFD